MVSKANTRAKPAVTTSSAKAEDGSSSWQKAPPPSDAKSLLGQRLRGLRTKEAWTLDELSKRSGVSRSTLSKIENGLISPTYDVLQSISSGFRIDLVELFSTSPVSSPIGRRSVTRAESGKFYDAKTYQYEMLATDLTKKSILPFKAKIAARDISEFGGWIRHEGEEFLCVVSGAVRVFTEHYEPVDLNAGDSVYFDSLMGHACISISPRDAEVLWVCTSARPGLVETSAPAMKPSFGKGG